MHKFNAAKRLQKELAVTHGMINEIIMKCVLLQNKMISEKSDNQSISSELLDQFTDTNAKFHIEIPRYRRRLLRINKELGEIYGTH